MDHLIMDHPIEDYIIHFLSRQESVEDIEKLKTWLAEDVSNKQRLKEWLQVWDAADMVANYDTYDTQEACQKFLIYIKEERSKAKPKTILIKTLHQVSKVAAIFILSFVLGAGSFYYYFSHQSKEITAYVENIVPLGSKSEIILPDGSSVWLNAGSKLRYSTNYGKTDRNIFLEGEGYFKVAKNENKAFTVHTTLMSVKALGTEFNVKAYPEEDIVETTLISGQVAIESETMLATTNKPVVLKPGQKYSIRSETGNKPALPTQALASIPTKIAEPQIMQLSTDIVRAEVSWKEKNWRIEKENLQSLALKLERRYDVRIQIDGELMNYHFTGTLKDESLEQVLRAMQSSAPILYNVEGKDVNIIADLQRMR